jgi:hypothetical protein
LVLKKLPALNFQYCCLKTFWQGNSTSHFEDCKDRGCLLTRREISCCLLQTAQFFRLGCVPVVFAKSEALNRAVKAIAGIAETITFAVLN